MTCRPSAAGKNTVQYTVYISFRRQKLSKVLIHLTLVLFDPLVIPTVLVPVFAVMVVQQPAPQKPAPQQVPPARGAVAALVGANVVVVAGGGGGAALCYAHLCAAAVGARHLLLVGLREDFD